MNFINFLNVVVGTICFYSAYESLKAGASKKSASIGIIAGLLNYGVAWM